MNNNQENTSFVVISMHHDIVLAKFPSKYSIKKKTYIRYLGKSQSVNSCNYIEIDWNHFQVWTCKGTDISSCRRYVRLTLRSKHVKPNSRTKTHPTFTPTFTPTHQPAHTVKCTKIGVHITCKTASGLGTSDLYKCKNFLNVLFVNMLWFYNFNV